MNTAPKAAEFWLGGGEATWKPAKPVFSEKLEKQGSSVVSSKPCYRVLTGTRARIWVKDRRETLVGQFAFQRFLHGSWQHGLTISQLKYVLSAL